MRSKDLRTIFYCGLLVIFVTTLSTAAFGASANNPAQPSLSEVPQTEHIYICLLYAPSASTKSKLTSLLKQMRAVDKGAFWTYTNSNQGKSYVIHFVENVGDMQNALYTEDAHIIINGHANYGMGGVFATPTEFKKQMITNIRYIDDDRIMNYSTPFFSVSITGLIDEQRYPNWSWYFKDGTSGVMPYDFNDPQGDPAYNYYLTYQLPGDQTHYKIESVNNSAIERFPDAPQPAWFSQDGSSPDPEDPDHLQYYITNSGGPFQSVGKWFTGTTTRGYYGTNYCYTPSGQGAKQAKWTFTVPEAGRYSVSAWWPASRLNALSPSYSIAHALGTTSVKVTQRSNGGRWNSLGEFSFEAGDYSILLSDSGRVGLVVADAVRITSKNNASGFDLIIDNTNCPKTHYRKKTILFRKDLEIDQARLGYKRMYYESCNSGIYFLESFHRGLMFYTLHDSDGSGVTLYLQSYLQGKSDEEIWSTLQSSQPVFDYYDFTKLPTEQ